MLCAPEATRTTQYSTVRAHHRTVGPKSGHRVSNTQANAEHGGEGVVGGFAADRRLGGSGGGCWVLIPKGRRVVLLSRKTFHTRCVVCVKVSVYEARAISALLAPVTAQPPCVTVLAWLGLRTQVSMHA